MRKEVSGTFWLKGKISSSARAENWNAKKIAEDGRTAPKADETRQHGILRRAKMKDKKETWVPIAWHCPHCGNRSQAQKTAGDTIKAECAGCLTVMVRRRIGRRHTRFDIYAPRRKRDSAVYLLAEN